MLNGVIGWCGNSRCHPAGGGVYRYNHCCSIISKENSICYPLDSLEPQAWLICGNRTATFRSAVRYCVTFDEHIRKIVLSRLQFNDCAKFNFVWARGPDFTLEAHSLISCPARHRKKWRRYVEMAFKT